MSESNEANSGLATEDPGDAAPNMRNASDETIDLDSPPASPFEAGNGAGNGGGLGGLGMDDGGDSDAGDDSSGGLFDAAPADNDTAPAGDAAPEGDDAPEGGLFDSEPAPAGDAAPAMDLPGAADSPLPDANMPSETLPESATSDLFGGDSSATPADSGLFGSDSADAPAESPFGGNAGEMPFGDSSGDAASDTDTTSGLFGGEPAGSDGDSGLFGGGDAGESENSAMPGESLFNSPPAGNSSPAADGGADSSGGLFDAIPSSDSTTDGLFDSAPATPSADPGPSDSLFSDSSDASSVFDNTFGGSDSETEELAPPANDTNTDSGLFGTPGANDSNDDDSLNDLFGDSTPVSTPAAESSGSGILDDLFGTPVENVEPSLPAADVETPKSTDQERFESSIDDLFGGASYRQWNDNTGNFQTRAMLVEIYPTKIRIRKENGKYATVPVSRLSKTDFDYVNWVAKSLDVDATRLVSTR